MGCFCQMSRTALVATMPSLNVSASASMMLGAGVPLGLSAYLGAAGLPAAPWAPLPDWQLAPLPTLNLSLGTAAAISALAQLQAQVMAQFGLNLMIPAQAQAFARIVATMNAQLSAIVMPFNPLGWIQLGALNAAIDQVNLAISLGLLPPAAEMLLALNLPGGVPMPSWRALLAYLRALIPVISACLQLNIALEPAALAVAIRALLQVQLPPLAMPELMANLTASLQAVASLQASLGVPALQLGLPAIQALVQAKLTVMLQALPGMFRIQVPSLGQLLAALLALLPPLPLVPTTFATPLVVQMALSAPALAALSWQVNATPPCVTIGLPTVALTAQLSATLGLQAVLSAPCPMGCHANAVLSAAMSA